MLTHFLFSQFSAEYAVGGQFLHEGDGDGGLVLFGGVPHWEFQLGGSAQRGAPPPPPPQGPQQGGAAEAARSPQAGVEPEGARLLHNHGPAQGASSLGHCQGHLE